MTEFILKELFHVKKTHVLSDHASNILFEELFLKFLKNHYMENLDTKLGCFYEIPMGHNEVLPCIKPKFDPPAPKIKYLKKEDERICLITSVCNTLYFLNLKEAAKKIWNEKDSVLLEADAKKQWKIMHELVTLHTGIFKPVKVETNIGEYRFQSETYCDDSPLICALEGSDGKIEHVVGISNSYIFDGSFEYALMNTKHNLDICCSSDTVKSYYVKVYCGYYYREEQNKPKKYLENFIDYQFE